MKKPASQARKPRTRLVLGYPGLYAQYLRNFLYTPVTARRLERPDMLDGLRPPQVLVVLLPSWKEEAMRTPGLFSRVVDWRDRWRDIGLEEIPELELVGGMPVRQANLFKEYQRRLETVGSNSLAIDSAKDWLTRLDERDADLLLKAINEHKNAILAAGKKSLNLPLCDERL